MHVLLFVGFLIALSLPAGCQKEEDTVIPPAQPEPFAGITDLTATTSTTAVGAVDLTWTAGGTEGTGGDAFDSYEVRYSNLPFTSSDWPTAQVFAQNWVPRDPGETETYEISGLNPGMYYWFAIRAFDAAGTASELSNVASATASQEMTPPASITDLTAVTSPSTVGGVVLSWTAVGDDGTSGGPATGYQVRASTSPITAGSWGSAMSISQSWIPLGPGQTETHEVAGLNPGSLYYFAIKVQDEVPNVSGMSNVASEHHDGGRGGPELDGGGGRRHGGGCGQHL
jgi:hypothetical protein